MRVSDDPRVGTELAGYRIESLLGWGGMSVVYLAEDLRLKRKVALKLPAASLAEDGAFRDRFLRESELAGDAPSTGSTVTAASRRSFAAAWRRKPAPYPWQHDSPSSRRPSRRSCGSDTALWVAWMLTIATSNLGEHLRLLSRREVAAPDGDADQRSERNAARTSVVKMPGSSQAAKWPPFSTALK